MGCTGMYWGHALMYKRLTRCGPCTEAVKADSVEAAEDPARGDAKEVTQEVQHLPAQVCPSFLGVEGSVFGCASICLSVAIGNFAQ